MLAACITCLESCAACSQDLDINHKLRPSWSSVTGNNLGAHLAHFPLRTHGMLRLLTAPEQSAAMLRTHIPGGQRLFMCMMWARIHPCKHTRQQSVGACRGPSATFEHCTGAQQSMLRAVTHFAAASWPVPTRHMSPTTKAGCCLCSVHSVPVACQNVHPTAMLLLSHNAYPAAA